MKILNSSYSVGTENYNKPTPKWIKFTADLLLLLSAIVVFAPEFPGKEWVMFAGSAAKLLSKFITDHTVGVAEQKTPEP